MTQTMHGIQLFGTVAILAAGAFQWLSAGVSQRQIEKEMEEEASKNLVTYIVKAYDGRTYETKSGELTLHIQQDEYCNWWGRGNIETSWHLNGEPSNVIKRTVCLQRGLEIDSEAIPFLNDHVERILTLANQD